MATSRLPYVITLNCLEQSTEEMAEALSDLCVLEHVGLVEGMLEKVSVASVVVLPSIQYLPRAAQRKLAPTQLLLCVGAGSDMRAVETSVAEELGLRLFHVDIPRADEVADTVMALLLGLMRKSHTLASQGCTSASWHGGFRDAWAGMRRLKGLTLGLVGVNASGRAVARRALAFGMKIVYCDLESELLGADVAEAKRKGKVRKALQGAGKGMMTLRQTVEQSDIVSLHCSLKDDTLHLINDKTISYFKKGTVLVNASSCHLVSDSAIKRALQSGLLSCCALDGVEGPQWMESWVREFPNVLILPRSADHSTEAWSELSRKVVQVLRTFLTEGRIPHDAVVVEDIETEEAAWGVLGMPPAAPGTPAGTPGGAGVRGSPAPGTTPASASFPSSPAPASTRAAPTPGGPVASPAKGGGASSQAPKVEIPVGPSPGKKPASAMSAAAQTAVGGAAAAAGLGPREGSSKDGKVSFGEVEVIQNQGVGGAASPSGDPRAATEGYERQGSSNNLIGDASLPLLDGCLISLRPIDKPAHLYAAKKPASGKAPFALVVRPEAEVGRMSSAAQFVVVTESGLMGCQSVLAKGKLLQGVMGCRSVLAKGKFLQAAPNGELVFANEDLELPESWLPEAPEPGRIRLTNAANDKVVLEAFVDILT